MLTFYPAVGPNVPPGATQNATMLAVDAAFTPFPQLPAPVPCAISLGELAIALLADSNFAFNPLACIGLMQSALWEQPGGALVGRDSLRALPVHHKRVMSELVGVAAALSTADHLGFDFFCTFTEINALFNLFGYPQPIQRIWAGNGPDYLLANTTTMTFQVMECKGTARSIAHKPHKFVEFKAQSLNARVLAGAILGAHVLSYTHLRAGNDLACRWFNHRLPDVVGEQAAKLVTAIAFCHFTNLLINGRLQRLARQLRNRLGWGEQVAQPEADEYPEVRLVEEGGFHMALGVDDRIVLAIDSEALTLFQQIADGQWLTNDELALDFANALRQLATSKEQIQQRFVRTRPLAEVFSSNTVGVVLAAA